jgi:hypothetical protein
MAGIYIDSREKLPFRNEFDLYPTQRALIRAAIPHALSYKSPTPGRTRSLLPFRILDPGAGDGRWGLEAKQYFSQFYSTVTLTGVEIRDVPKPNGYDHWYANTDIREWKPPFTKFHLAVGNPPFNIAAALLEICFRAAYETFMLLPRDFGGGTGRFDGLFRTNPLFQECPSARRPSFSGDNKTGATVYSMWHWRNGVGEPNAWITRQFNWETDPADLVPVAVEIRKIRDKANRTAKKDKQLYFDLIAQVYAERQVTPTFVDPVEEKDFQWRFKAYVDHIMSGEKESVQEPVTTD